MKSTPIGTLIVRQPFLVLVIAAALVGSCTSIRPMTERSQIEGRPAQRLVIVLDRPFSFKHLLSTYTLPAGGYVPTLEDDSGVYFVAPSKIVGSEILAASFLYDGGLYFRTDGSKQIEAYVVVRNQPLFVALPGDFRYALDQRADAG